MTKEEKNERINQIIRRLSVYPTNVQFCNPTSPLTASDVAGSINSNAVKLQEVSQRVNDLSELMLLLSTKTEDNEEVNTNSSSFELKELQEITERNSYEIQETAIKVDDLYKIVSALSSEEEEAE